MAFRPVNYEEGKVQLVKAADAQAIVKGDALVDNGSGYLALAASNTAVDIKYIAMETVTTTADGQLVLALPTDGVRFNADCDAAPAQTDVGTYCDLAGDSTLNPDASTHDLFYIEAIDLTGGAVGTSTKVFGRFVGGVPNS
jgi:hypothetical protein